MQSGIERPSNENWLGREMEFPPSFYFHSFDNSIRQIEACKPKAEEVMGNHLESCIVEIFTRLLCRQA